MAYTKMLKMKHRAKNLNRNIARICGRCIHLRGTKCDFRGYCLRRDSFVYPLRSS